MSRLFDQSEPTLKLVQRLERRDVALWIGSASAEDKDAVADLAGLPWRLVLVESRDAQIARTVADHANLDEALLRKRGFTHVVAADPAGIQLPLRSLPVYFMNGIAGRSGLESIDPGRLASLRRRLNTLERLQSVGSTEIVVIGTGTDEPLRSVRELWSEGMRFLLSVVSPHPSDREAVEGWLVDDGSSPPAIDFYATTVATFSAQLATAYRKATQTDRTRIYLRRGKVALREIDITKCELAEQPIFDRYDVITRPATAALQPEELSFSDIEGFFDRSVQSWRPYAGGLPWRRDPQPFERVRKALEKVEREGPQANRLMLIESEAGAGGTTLARMIAFEMATKGFPTLVARGLPFAPSAIELSTFLLRFLRLPEVDTDPPVAEVPWLLVFDVHHWSGRELDLRSFLNQLSNDGRAVVVLAVVNDDAFSRLEGAARLEPLTVLRHEVDRDDALALGMHLNRFLKVHGRVKDESAWLQFWEQHRPSIDSPISSFWIALEFWLKGMLELGVSIQQWMFRQFVDLQAPPPLAEVVLQIAALSVEREPLADALLPRIPNANVPTSTLLDEVRVKAPALGLLSESSDQGRRWALAHTQQGRHLLNAAFFDRRLCTNLGLEQARNPVHLRLMLLARIASKPELAALPFRSLGIDFAIRIFKLDPGQSGEFFPLWRDALAALEGVSPALKQTSRTFLHHGAISRRRVATNTNYFDADDVERNRLLEEAIRDIESALGLPRQDRDEGDLNLWNSLSLAYQNLADLRRRAGAERTEVDRFRAKATEATLRAQQEDPLNPYVLETAAKNLVQSASLNGESRIRDTTQALGFIHEAMARDRSSLRQQQLSRLFQDAIKLLSHSDSKDAIDRLMQSGSWLGYVAATWLYLAETLGPQHTFEDATQRIDLSVATEALAILNSATGDRGFPWLKLCYDLTAIAESVNFERQLELLEEMEGMLPHLPFQYQLEHAVLLHQVGRHFDADRRFNSLRRAFKEHDVYVDVPSRMQWLLAPGRQRRQSCEARVSDVQGYRHRAKVKDLGNVVVPFIPQEFGRRAFAVGEVFSVGISFGALGPFAKPPSVSG